MTNVRLSKDKLTKRIIKYLTIAYSGSQSGKDLFDSNIYHNVHESDYTTKEQFIIKAIKYLNKHKYLKKNISIYYNTEWVKFMYNEYPMNIVYFNIKGYPQISFHTFISKELLDEYIEYKNNAWDRTYKTEDSLIQLNKEYKLYYIK